MRRRLISFALAILPVLAAGSPSVVPRVVDVDAAQSSPVLLRDNQAAIDTLVPKVGACPLVSPPDGCFENDTQSEPSIAVDPTNRDHAVAVFHVGRADDGGAAADGYSVTFDQGRTWRQGLFPGLTQASGTTLQPQRVSDPRVAFAPDGRHVYATAQPYNNDVAPAFSSVVSMTSADGGVTWAPPVVVVSDQVSQNISQSDAYLLNHGFDQPDLVVDVGGGAGHHTGRIYLAWVRLTLVDFAYAAYSDDGGTSWIKGPNGPNSPVDQGFVVNQGSVPLYPRPVVLGNGDLAVMDWNALPNYVVQPIYFGDPGSVQSDPSTTSELNQTGGYQLYVAAGAGAVSGVTPLVFSAPAANVAYLANNTLRGQRSAEKQPLFAEDQRSGRLFAVWTDARFRIDAANDILVTYSDDRGATWNFPHRVNPGQPGDSLDHWCAMIDAGADGVLRIGYRQRQEAPTTAAPFTNLSPSVDTFYVESRDGGRSFGAPLKVSTNISDMRFGAFDGGQTNVGQGGIFLGDYDAMAEKDGITYMVRSEPVRTSPAEKVVFPPPVHHQRIWVAVVGEVAGVSATPTPATGTSALPRVLPDTARGVRPGRTWAVGAAVLVLIALLLVAGPASAIRRRR
ncbi:MAG: sialidase family protein [Candidatus Dormibacteria bacterium]